MFTTIFDANWASIRKLVFETDFVVLGGLESICIMQPDQKAAVIKKTSTIFLNGFFLRKLF
jgi:hypothetical protein